MNFIEVYDKDGTKHLIRVERISAVVETMEGCVIIYDICANEARKLSTRTAFEQIKTRLQR